MSGLPTTHSELRISTVKLDSLANMSDTFLRLIPVLPDFVPSREAAEAAIGRLKGFAPNASQIEAQWPTEIQFVDQGGNFERLLCPQCGTEVTNRFSDWMETAYQSRFEKRRVSLPCCGKDSDLNDLVWQWPAGFARFILEAMNPELPGWLPEANQKEIEMILACKVRQIYAHY
jgi:hypothetical protein